MLILKKNMIETYFEGTNHDYLALVHVVAWYQAIIWVTDDNKVCIYASTSLGNLYNTNKGTHLPLM